jgi:hypothetical protein
MILYLANKLLRDARMSATGTETHGAKASIYGRRSGSHLFPNSHKMSGLPACKPRLRSSDLHLKLLGKPNTSELCPPGNSCPLMDTHETWSSFQRSTGRGGCGTILALVGLDCSIVKSAFSVGRFQAEQEWSRTTECAAASPSDRWTLLHQNLI